MGAILVYSEECPYCRNIARAIGALDLRGVIEKVPIESTRGRELVTDHHGEFVDAPHLFTDKYAYYGVSPVAKRLPRLLAKGE